MVVDKKTTAVVCMRFGWLHNGSFLLYYCNAVTGTDVLVHLSLSYPHLSLGLLLSYCLMTWKRFRKKQKVQDGKPCSSTTDSGLGSKHGLISLPFELLLEILSYVSTKEVLALARCNLFLFHTLVNNSRTKQIWVSARTRCIPPLPDPTPNFTESSYAAFIFDGGYCEVSLLVFSLDSRIPIYVSYLNRIAVHTLKTSMSHSCYAFESVKM